MNSGPNHFGAGCERAARARMPAASRGSSYSFQETYELYNEQMHYARATYTLEQLDRWQSDWNAYFAKHGMEIPAYAHRVKARPQRSETAPLSFESGELNA